jgi:hypothetical protein
MGYIPQIVNNADKEDNESLTESKQRDDFDANTRKSANRGEILETTPAALCMTVRYTGLT